MFQRSLDTHGVTMTDDTHVDRKRWLSFEKLMATV